jgi:hypothetical protein
MKAILFFLASCFVLQLNARDTVKASDKKLFVRLYDNLGEKVGKGDLQEGSDSTIQIKHQHKDLSFPISKIHF